MIDQGLDFSIPHAELVERSIADLQGDLTSRVVSAVESTQAYLDRIGATNDAGPALRAILEVNPDALDIAASLDRERQAGQVRGLLHGIPILVKDNIDTNDGMLTTAGSVGAG